jgi:hypothetical protein
MKRWSSFEPKMWRPIIIDFGHYHYQYVVCHAKKETNAQIAHLVFANTQANPKKTKRAVFSQRIEDKNEELNKK